MLVIDGPPADLNKCARFPAGPLLFPVLNNKSVVFLDDASRADEKSIVEKWLNDFPELDLFQYDCEKGAIGLLKNSG